MEGQVWSGIWVRQCINPRKIFSPFITKNIGKKTRKMYRQREEASIPGSQIEGLTLRQIERQTTNKYTDPYLYCKAGKNQIE